MKKLKGWIIYYSCAIIVITVLIFGLFSCTELTEEKNVFVNNGVIEFCNQEILDTWCWDGNDDTWNTLDLSSYTNGQSIVEVSLEFVDSLDPGIDAASIGVRRNNTSQEYNISANHIQGTRILLTDENGNVEWKHDMNIDVTRKINIKIKLTMIQQ